MKILFINNFHYRFGGASVVYLNTAEILQNQGHQICYFSILDENNVKSTSEKYFIDKKVAVNDSLINKAKNITNYFYNKQASSNLGKLLEEEKPDIAHIHLFYGGITSSILPVLKKFGVPVIHTVHDYRLICPAYTFLDGKGSICEACAGKKFYNCALKKCSKGDFIQSVVMSIEMYYRNIFFNPTKYIDGFSFVSEFSRNKHMKYLPKIRLKSSMVLYNFAEINGNLTDKKEDYFLFYGRISHEKGLLTLLNVLKIMPKIHLKIVGTGPQLEILEKYVEDNKLQNVEFLGFKSGNELIDIVSKAYFVIVPSEWYENNPMTIVESYCYGTPVIGANVGGIPEIIKDGETGYIFTSRDVNSLIDKINKALSISKEMYSNLCANAHEFAFENFNERLYCENLLNYYYLIIHNYRIDKKQ